eukprot:tig00000180_g13642.t1
MDATETATALARRALELEDSDPAEASALYAQASSYAVRAAGMEPSQDCQALLAIASDSFRARSGVVRERAAAAASPQPQDGALSGRPQAPAQQPLSAELPPLSGEEAEMAEGLLASVLERRPTTRWGDVAGASEAKAALHESVILPALMPHLFRGVRQPWLGVLMHGPPGTGKTQLARATAAESGASFFAIGPSVLMSKWAGQSERCAPSGCSPLSLLHRRARALAQAPSVRGGAESARPAQEVDALTGSRGRGGDGDGAGGRRVLTELLIQAPSPRPLARSSSARYSPAPQMSGLRPEERVTILGPRTASRTSTRHPPRRVLVPLPDLSAREAIVRRLLADLPCDPAFDARALATATDGYSGADLECLVRDAVMEPVRELSAAFAGASTVAGVSHSAAEPRPTRAADFEAALRRIKPAAHAQAAA